MNIRPRAPGFLVKNAFLNTAGWGTSVLLSLLITPFLLNRLGVDGYGIFALLTGLTGYSLLLDLGLGQSLIRLIPFHYAAGEFEAANRALNTAVFIQFILGIVAAATIVLFSDSILALVMISSGRLSEARSGLLAMALSLFFITIGSSFNSLLMGLQRYDLTSRLSVLRELASNTFIVVVLSLGGGLRATLWSSALVSMVAVFFSLWLARRTFPQWSFSLRLQRSVFVDMFSVGFYMFLVAIAQSFTVYFMRFIISAISGPTTVAYYAVPHRILIAFGGFLTTATAVLLPFSAEADSRKEVTQLRRLYVKVARYNIALAYPVPLLLAIFSGPILTAWIGPEFASQAAPVMFPLCCYVGIVSSTAAIPALVAMGLGKSRLVAGYALLATGITAATAVPLIHRMGAAGAGVAALLASPVWVIFSFRSVATILDISPAEHYRNIYKVHLTAGSALLAGVAALEQLWPPAGAVSLLAWFTVSLIAYYALLAVLGTFRVSDFRQLVAGGRAT